MSRHLIKFLICIVILVSFVFVCFSCRWNLNESNSKENLEITNDFYSIESSDPILKDVVCESFVNTGIFSNCNGDKPPEGANVYRMQIDSTISETSIDFWRNTFYSLVTLTLGAFVSASGELSFQVEVTKDGAARESFQKEYRSEGQNGVRAIMPPVTGFISTIGGSFLNYYRKPDRLKHYCLIEVPDKVRAVFEESHEEFCENYRVYLQDAYRKIELDLMKDLANYEAVESP